MSETIQKRFEIITTAIIKMSFNTDQINTVLVMPRGLMLRGLFKY